MSGLPKINNTIPNGKGTKTIQKKLTVSKTKKIKLTKFDKDLFKLIVGGMGNLQEISTEFSIGSAEVETRIDELIKLGLIAIENGSAKLTIKSYNLFKVKKSKTPVQQIILQPPIKVSELEIEPNGIGEENAKQKPHRSDQVDLNELLRRGAPIKNQSDFNYSNKQNENNQSEKKIPSINETITKEEKSSEEVCQLCKESFKLAMTDSRPKYGHCFCGAAYHKDCYEGILSTDGKCIRCGRKLELELQKETKEELRKIRNIFED